MTKSELKYLATLSLKKARRAERKFVLEGWRGLHEAVHSSFVIEYVAVVPEQRENPEHRSLLSLIREKKIPIKEISHRELQKVSDTVHAQGVVALVHQCTWTLEDVPLDGHVIVVALDGISDPGNLGSIIRTADWFGASAVLLGEGCVELHNEKVIRSTAGSIFHLPIVEKVNLVDAASKLRRKGFSISSLSADGQQAIHEVEFTQKQLFVVGSEAHGIGAPLRSESDHILKIPRFGAAESLNVVVACGIVLAQVRWNMERSLSGRGD